MSAPVGKARGQRAGDGFDALRWAIAQGRFSEIERTRSEPVRGVRLVSPLDGPVPVREEPWRVESAR